MPSHRSDSNKPLPRKQRVLNRGYLYSRKDEDGTIHPFIDSKGEEHKFENIDNLWEFLLYWAEEMMRP